MTELSTLANALLAARPAEPNPSPAAVVEQLRTLASLALELGTELGADLRRFAELTVELGDSRLAECLLDLPLRLANANESDSALAVARLFEFIAPDKLRGDSAVILAQAGHRDEALARVAENLERAQDTALAESKAGDAYRALGDDDAAQAYYRRALAEAKTPFERAEAVLRIVSLLSDAGRESEAARFLAEERKRPAGG